MMQREVQVTIAAVLAGWLLATGTAWAQPAEPARPAAEQPAEPARPAAEQPAEPARPTARQPVAPPADPGAAQPVPAAALATPAASPAAPAAALAAPAASPATPAAKTDKPAPSSGTPATGAALPPGTSIKVERTARGAKLFRITEGLLVEGQMQRPNAFLVLQRATVDYDYETLSESFLPRILAATREKPF